MQSEGDAHQSARDKQADRDRRRLRMLVVVTVLVFVTVVLPMLVFMPTFLVGGLGFMIGFVGRHTPAVSSGAMGRVPDRRVVPYVP